MVIVTLCKAFDTSKELDDYMVKGGEAMNVFYGVDFKNPEWNQNGSLPKTLDYALRPVASPRSESSESVEGRSGWLTNLLFSRRPAQNGPTAKNSEYGGKPFYYKDLFLEMQHIIDYLFIAKAAAKGTDIMYLKLKFSTLFVVEHLVFFHFSRKLHSYALNDINLKKIKRLI